MISINKFLESSWVYSIVIILIVHLIIRHTLIKILAVFGQEEWYFSLLLSSVIYGAGYLICTYSFVRMFPHIKAYYKITWIIIFCLTVINEIRFFLHAENYNLYESIFYGQFFTNIKISFGILLIGVWDGIRSKNKSLSILNLVESLTLINCLIVVCAYLLNIEVFESYFQSERWGYSGVLPRGYSVILPSIFLISRLQEAKKNYWVTSLYFACLILSGTKAGLFSVLLIILFVLLSSIQKKIYFLFLLFLLLISINFWLPYFIVYSPFWEKVYSEGGAMGLITSFRSDSLNLFYNSILPNYDLADWVIGGNIRFEEFRVEILPVSVFMYFGFLGLLSLLYFVYKMKLSWVSAIPVIVAIGSGSLLAFPVGLFVWAIWTKGFRSKYTKNIIE